MTDCKVTPEESAAFEAHERQWWASTLTFGLIPKPEPLTGDRVWTADKDAPPSGARADKEAEAE